MVKKTLSPFHINLRAKRSEPKFSLLCHFHYKFFCFCFFIWVDKNKIKIWKSLNLNKQQKRPRTDKKLVLYCQKNIYFFSSLSCRISLWLWYISVTEVTNFYNFRMFINNLFSQINAFHAFHNGKTICFFTRFKV